MIFDAISNFIYNIFAVPLSGLDPVSLPFNSVSLQPFEQSFRLLAYIFPITLCFECWIALLTLRFSRVIVALIVRIKSFIPTMGA